MLKFLVISVAVIWVSLLITIIGAFIHGRLKRYKIYEMISSRFRRLPYGITEAERRIRSCELAHPAEQQSPVPGGESIPYEPAAVITVSRSTQGGFVADTRPPPSPPPPQTASQKQRKQGKKSKFDLSGDD